jgi:hypothetical protein
MTHLVRGLIARSRSSGCNLNAFSSRVGTMTGSPPFISTMCWSLVQNGAEMMTSSPLFIVTRSAL